MSNNYARVKIPLFAVDFEGAKSCGILEYAIAKICDWQIVSLKSNICAPKSKVSQKTLELCDLHFDKLKNLKKFDDYIDDFVDARKSGLLIAHNKSAEDSMLKSYFPNPCTFDDFLGDNKIVCTWAPWIDTFRLVKNIFPNLKSYALSDLIGIFNLQKNVDNSAEKFCPQDRQKWHCAPYDTIACAEILIMISKLEGFENLSIDWLVKFSKSDTQEELF